MEVVTYFILQIQLDETGKQICCQNYALFHNKNRAQRFVKRNATNLNETCFNYACVEGIRDSVCPFLDDGIVYRQFYKFNYQTDKYEECETPEIYKNEYFSLAF